MLRFAYLGLTWRLGHDLVGWSATSWSAEVVLKRKTSWVSSRMSCVNHRKKRRLSHKMTIESWRSFENGDQAISHFINLSCDPFGVKPMKNVQRKSCCLEERRRRTKINGTEVDELITRFFFEHQLFKWFFFNKNNLIKMWSLPIGWLEFSNGANWQSVPGS